VPLTATWSSTSTPCSRHHDRTTIIFLCSPNNPTGKAEHNAVDRLLDTGIPVVVDQPT